MLDLFLIPMLIHVIKNIMLAHGGLILKGQQGCNSCRAAAKVSLLSYCGEETAFIVTDNRDMQIDVGGRDVLSTRDAR